MSRGKWDRIKKSKFFYVNTYRRIIAVIVFSQLFNLTLCLLIAYFYLHKPIQHFYATNGEEPATELKPRDKPNESSVALLAPDPEDEHIVKNIPD